MDNLLAAETIITDRLAEAMPALTPAPRIATAKDLGELDNGRQITPAVYVVYEGMLVAQTQARGQLATLEQRWLTVVTTRSATARGQATTEAPGKILAAVWNTLAGYAPGAGYSPITPRTPPSSGYQGGFAYHPLAWTLPIHLKTTQDPTP